MSDNVANQKIEVSPEELARHISGLANSLLIVNDIVQGNNVEDDRIEVLIRNYTHIDSMLSIDFIKNSGEDLSLYVDSIEAAKLFIENNS